MRLRRTHAMVAAIGMLLVGVLPASAGAPAPTVGWLDPTFGTRGVVQIPRPVAGVDASAWGVVSVGPSGRIFTFARRAGDDRAVRPVMALTAFTASGRLDRAIDAPRSTGTIVTVRRPYRARNRAPAGIANVIPATFVAIAAMTRLMTPPAIAMSATRRKLVSMETQLLTAFPGVTRLSEGQRADLSALLDVALGDSERPLPRR